MNDRRTIIVDMTPMLPGAVNGGAKILVLELLRRLPKLAPDTDFVLLTRQSSHDELASFECDNVARELTWMDVERQTRRNRFSQWFACQDSRLIRKLPPRLRRARYDLRRLAGARSPSSKRKTVPNLMFSPFGLSEEFQGRDYFALDLPTVAILYDLQHRHYPEFFAPPEIAKRDRNFQRHRTSSVMACISDFVRDSAIDAGVASDAVVTIHIRLKHRLAAVDTETVARVLRDLRLHEDSYLLYPANFWPHKNHATLLEAFSIARREGLPPQVKLVCTGAPGAGEVEVKKLAGALGLSNAVVFPGFLNDTQFSVLLRSACGIVFPSLYEGFGMPVIEAMAASRPVACSNSTSLREIAGDAALLFDPKKPQDTARSIGQLVTDESLRSLLMKRGVARANMFSDTELMARQYLRLFDNALQRWRARPRAATHQDVSGIYGDGWAAPGVVVRYGCGSADRSLRISLQAPGFDSIRRYLVSIDDTLGTNVARRVIVPGTSSIIEIPLGDKRGVHTISITPFFRPIELRELGETTDARRLTVMVRSIEICEPGSVTTIFSAGAP